MGELQPWTHRQFVSARHWHTQEDSSPHIHCHIYTKSHNPYNDYTFDYDSYLSASSCRLSAVSGEVQPGTRVSPQIYHTTSSTIDRIRTNKDPHSRNFRAPKTNTIVIVRIVSTTSTSIRIGLITQWMVTRSNVGWGDTYCGLALSSLAAKKRAAIAQSVQWLHKTTKDRGREFFSQSGANDFLSSPKRQHRLWGPLTPPGTIGIFLEGEVATSGYSDNPLPPLPTCHQSTETILPLPYLDQ